MSQQSTVNSINTHYATSQKQSAEVQYLLAEEKHRDAEAKFDTAYSGEVGLLGIDVLLVSVGFMVGVMRKGIEKDNPQLKQLLTEFENLKKDRSKLCQNKQMTAQEVSDKVKSIDARMKEIKESLPWKRIMLMQFKDKWIDIYIFPILSALAYVMAAYSLWLWKTKNRLKKDLDQKRHAYIKEQMDKAHKNKQQVNV